MGTSSLRPLDRLRQPEYTGENRCMPCTTVNVLIAIVLAVAIAVVQPVVAVVVFTLSLAAIYLRGYLVPGTPTLTQRYLPEWVLAKFGKADFEAEADASAAIETDREPDAESPESVDPEAWLLEHEVLVPCEDVDDLCLPEEIGEAYHGRFDRFREGDRVEDVSAFLEIDPEGVTVDEEGYRNVRKDGRLVARWRSEGPLVADLAAASVLAERVPEWETLTVEQRSNVAGGLRAFAERCPLCGESVALDEEEQMSCCGRTRMVYTVGCEGCGETLLEFRDSASLKE